MVLRKGARPTFSVSLIDDIEAMKVHDTVNDAVLLLRYQMPGLGLLRAKNCVFLLYILLNLEDFAELSR